MIIPQYNLLYFKEIINRCMIKFIDDNNELFIRNDDGKYVLAKAFSKTKLSKIFIHLVNDEIQQIITPFDRLNPQYYFIIGSCNPCDNLLNTIRTNVFPTRLESIINDHPHIKYVLSETDILINADYMNDMLNAVFNHFFNSTHNSSNVIFIKHSSLDCYLMFKVLKWIYGNSACVNMFTDTNYHTDRKCLIAINDLIEKYANNKRLINKSVQFKDCVNEIKSYLAEKVK